MRQYFTYREIPFQNYFVTPDETIRKCFVGMKMQFKLSIIKSENDGRLLGWVEADTEDKINAILEGLSFFGVHRKDNEKAKEFAAKMLKKTVTLDAKGKLFIKIKNKKFEL